MTETAFLDGRVVLHAGDCRDVIRSLPDASIDSCVTDPPYALVSIGRRFGADNAAPAKVGKSGAYARASAGFMGKKWDTGEVAFDPEFWAEVLRVLKPGAHLVAFGGTRSYHRLACAIEDAGFEIRDQLAWAYGSGFPKSHDVAKAIAAKEVLGGARTTDLRRMAMGDGYQPSGRGRANYDHGGGSSMNGRTSATPLSAAAEPWEGWGTALKPAWEPIVLARKPLIGTVAETVLAHGTGALNIDGCRVGTEVLPAMTAGQAQMGTFERTDMVTPERVGRWPANIVHDGSDEVIASFPSSDGQRAAVGPQHGVKASVNTYGDFGPREHAPPRGDTGSAARFFYSAKADANDRIGSKHPTVKPVDLMQWLCRLVTPPGGIVLDPFAGTGTTGEAAFREGFKAVLIEREADYQADIARRMELALAGPDERARESLKARGKADYDAGPLFGGGEAA